jgi:acetyl esterase/lipase
MLKAVSLLTVLAATTAAQPIHFRVDGMERVSIVRDVAYKTTTVAGQPNQSLALDVYRGASAAPAPFVVFVHGGLSPRQQPVAKDWESYQSWGRVTAASGMTAVIMNHRMNTNDNVVDAVADVRDVITHVRNRAGEYGLDANRMCVAFFSAGGPIASAFLREPPPYLRCVVLYYPYLDLEHLRERTPFRGPYSSGYVDSLAGYSPRAALSRGPAQLPPIFLARAGQDAIPFLNGSVTRFMADAVTHNVTIDFVNHPTGVHGFDVLTRDDRTRDIIAQTLAFLRRNLR